MRIEYTGLSVQEADRIYDAIKGINYAINEFADFPDKADLKVNFCPGEIDFFISDSDETMAYTLIHTILFPGTEYDEMVRNILAPIRDWGYLRISYKGEFILNFELCKRDQIEKLIDKVSPKRDAKSLK